MLDKKLCDMLDSLAAEIMLAAVNQKNTGDNNAALVLFDAADAVMAVLDYDALKYRKAQGTA